MLGDTRLHFCSDAARKGHHWTKGALVPLKLPFLIIWPQQGQRKLVISNWIQGMRMRLHMWTPRRHTCLSTSTLMCTCTISGGISGGGGV